MFIACELILTTCLGLGVLVQLPLSFLVLSLKPNQLGL